jgi:hypothetical protein
LGSLYTKGKIFELINSRSFKGWLEQHGKQPVDEGIDNLAKGSTDDDCNCQVDNVTALNKVLKVFQEACNLPVSSLINYPEFEASTD